ncbi:MAG: trimethylamine methyltransferase family protein [Anaerolineales bacterium]
MAHCSVSVNSPLLFDAPMLEGLIAFAKLGQPVLIAPFVMAGVSGPATMAGALAQHNAEVLAGISLVQLVRAGTPVLYGSATSNADLLSGAPAIGSPESAISTVVSAQLARYYNVPSRGGGALTDSPVPDSQSGYERMFTLLASVLSGTHYLMHGVGILESYLTMSYAQFAMDLDLLAMVREFVRPFSITPETLALDAIAEVGPGGMFLDVAHTLERFREVHFRPQIAIRQPFEQWQAAGAIDATARARAHCRILLANYMEPPMDSAAANRLENFVDARRREILAG